jgi:uncharacterized membrane protein YfcA
MLRDVAFPMVSISFASMLPLIAVLLVTGAFAGLFAGLLGIGGGIVLVPALYYSFIWLGFEDDLMMHVSVATSFLIMIPIGLSSARAHWKKGAVKTELLKNIGPGVLIGVLIGTIIAAHINGGSLRNVFALSLLLLSITMFINPSRITSVNGMPGRLGAGMAGMFIGALASLIGIGGAIMSVPFMNICKIPMHHAVGTASALGVVISVPALIGYIYIGLGEEGRPPFSIGYANLLAWIVITPISVAIAPVGASIAHKLPAARLSKIFGCLLILLSLRMLYDG